MERTPHVERIIARTGSEYMFCSCLERTFLCIALTLHFLSRPERVSDKFAQLWPQ